MARDRWRPVVSNDAYAVSRQGRVKRIKPGRGATVGKVLAIRGMRYPRVNLQGKEHLVHRIVWRAFHGEIPEGKEINHIDGDRKNNDFSNLEVVTRSENMLHAYETGLQKPLYSEDNPNAFLSDDEIAEMRERYAAGGVTQTQLATEYGCGQDHVSRIINHRVRS